MEYFFREIVVCVCVRGDEAGRKCVCVLNPANYDLAEVSVIIGTQLFYHICHAVRQVRKNQKIRSFFLSSNSHVMHKSHITFKVVSCGVFIFTTSWSL